MPPGQSSENFGEKITSGQYIFAYSGFRPSVSFRQHNVILIRRTSAAKAGDFHKKNSAFSYRGECDRKTYSHCFCCTTFISIVMLPLSYVKAGEVWIISYTAMFLRKSEELKRNAISFYFHQS